MAQTIEEKCSAGSVRFFDKKNECEENTMMTTNIIGPVPKLWLVLNSENMFRLVVWCGAQCVCVCDEIMFTLLVHFIDAQFARCISCMVFSAVLCVEIW